MVPSVPTAINPAGFGGAPDISAWPEPATLVPVAINWTRAGRGGGGGIVDNWQSRRALPQRQPRVRHRQDAAPGVYQYKFIVDGEWKYAPDQPAMYDEMGNVNNVLEVQEYVPEILDSLDSFLAPSSRRRATTTRSSPRTTSPKSHPRVRRICSSRC